MLPRIRIPVSYSCNSKKNYEGNESRKRLLPKFKKENPGGEKGAGTLQLPKKGDHPRLTDPSHPACPEKVEP